MVKRPKELHSEETRRQFDKHWRQIEPTPEQVENGKPGCRMWQGSKDDDGYGQFRWNGELYRAHRFSYMLEHGEIPPGHDVDHTCHERTENTPRNYACVRPEHLEAVTHHENMRRQKARAGTERNPGLNLPQPKNEPSDAAIALQWCLDYIKDKKIARPAQYGVANMEGAPWRAYMEFDDLPAEKNDTLMLLALYLYAISMGCPSYQTGVLMFGIADMAIKRWNRNPDWKSDIEEARAESRRAVSANLREQVFDTLNTRIRFADVREAVRALSILKAEEADKRNAKRRKDGPVLGSGNTYIFNLEAPKEQHAMIAERIYDGVVRDVTDEDRPALPPPDEWDEDFGDD